MEWEWDCIALCHYYILLPLQYFSGGGEGYCCWCANMEWNESENNIKIITMIMTVITTTIGKLKPFLSFSAINETFTRVLQRKLQWFSLFYLSRYYLFIYHFKSPKVSFHKVWNFSEIVQSIDRTWVLQQFFLIKSGNKDGSLSRRSWKVHFTSLSFLRKQLLLTQMLIIIIISKEAWRKGSEVTKPSRSQEGVPFSQIVFLSSPYIKLLLKIPQCF